MKYNYKAIAFFAFVVGADFFACTHTSLSYMESVVPAPPQRASSAPTLTGSVRVYDGDSIFFGRIEVRLDAIDAPERDQACLNAAGKFWPCGIASRDVLRSMIGDGEVRCILSGKDKYRRLLGVCYVDGHDLNAAMVASGNAIAYHYFSDRYTRQEEQAKAQHIGIWQDAHFTEPYFCRHPETGHTCYAYDYMAGTGKIAQAPLIGKSHAIGAPD